MLCSKDGHQNMADQCLQFRTDAAPTYRDLALTEKRMG
jgi:hypothetical protein